MSTLHCPVFPRMMGAMAESLPLGERIRRARGRKDWTQQELARRVGKDRKTIDNWENGRTTPSGATIAMVEYVLGESLLDDPVPLDPDVEILMTLDLDPKERARLIEAYREIRAQSAGRNSA